MGRAVATFGGIFVLVLIASGLTEATLALGHRGSLANDILLRPHQAKLVPKPTSTPAPSTPIPASSPSPATPTPSSTPVVSTATTNGFVHMRAGKSTSTAILTDLNGGTVVELLSDSDTQWQQVSYNGLTGYIFKTYLTYQ